ncbi:MAG: hypothetical protein ACYDHX_16985 [Methanothrix sp.]
MNRNMRIILAEDCDSNAYRELCFDAGANEFLAKPVRVKELTEAIEHSGMAAKLSAI